jgi:class 3 adenylate cyclase/TolB-like protein
VSSPSPIRRLAAVLLADVAGYSRMMERDESGTHQRLREVRATITDPTIAAHHGRVVRSKGDDLLVEFGAATEALACAIDIQRAMADYNRGLAADSRIDFRIGINLGDILIDGADIAGDGVNVAARLESLAEPGGIAISAAVREQVRQLAGAQFSDLGAHRVKNIGRPIRVYSVHVGEGRGKPAALLVRLRRLRRPAAASALIGAAVILLVLIGAWPVFQKMTARSEPPRQSVLLLPVSNVSRDSAGDALARNLSARLSSALGQALGFGSKVVLAESAMVTSTHTDAQSLGRELGVRYVVGIELTSAGHPQRAAVALVTADTGAQVWSNVIEEEARNDGEIAPELIGRLAGGLSTQIRQAELARGATAEPPEAEWLVLRAGAVLSAAGKDEDLQHATRLYAQALRQSPDYVPALCGLTEALSYEANRAESGDVEAELMRRADEYSLHAISLAPNDADAWRARAQVKVFRGELPAATQALERSMMLNPYSTESHLLRARLLMRAGDLEGTIGALDTALRMHPTGDDVGVILNDRCRALLLLGRYADAIASCNRAIAFTPDWPDFMYLTAAYAMQGDHANAAKAKAELMQRRPTFRISWLLESERQSPNDFGQRAKNLLEGLRRAGVPE